MENYEKDFTERVEISDEHLSETAKLVVTGFMREGEFSYRAHLIELLEEEIALHDPNDQDSCDWSDGLRYCLKLVKDLGPLNA